MLSRNYSVLQRSSNPWGCYQVEGQEIAEDTLLLHQTPHDRLLCMERTFGSTTRREPLNSLRSRGSNMSKDEKATAILSTPFAVSPEQEKDIAEEDRMFHAFMKGYHREVHMTGQVLSSLVRAMDAYPSLRLGQLLYCAIRLLLHPTDNRGLTDEMLGRALFSIYDEALIEALDKFTEAKMKEKKP